ncbi:putative thioesterase family protein [Erysiphe neolycopersici]|uniref:Putative thioesterase family protein n=1 Tax=Erysiphe neolycopersici TaxID=212602 RepID=A0A420HXU1_9PEZI|nr:putative thioesterase family protein [Erysiphe neolycopersici]
MSTTTSYSSRVEKQPRHANLRSQLPLADIISPSSHSGAIDSSSSSVGLSNNTEGERQETIGSSKKSRSLRPYIYGFLFFAVGSLIGNLICSIVIPRDSLVPGSPEDLLMIKYLHEQAEKLPLVNRLSSDSLWSIMGTYTGEDTEGETGEMGNEPVHGKLVEEEINETRQRRLTIGPLGGSRALGGYQKMFRHIETGEIIKIFWLGPGISGWPGVAHGGVLATILDETLGHCAMGFLEGHTGVTANLQVNYLRPVLTNGFYVIRATKLEDQEGGNNEKKKFDDPLQKRKQWVTGTLENTAGELCVESKALFVVPKKYKLKILNP